EREIILAALDANAHHIANTARELGLERSHLYKKMRALGIHPRGGAGAEEEESVILAAMPRLATALSILVLVLAGAPARAPQPTPPPAPPPTPPPVGAAPPAQPEPTTP